MLVECGHKCSIHNCFVMQNLEAHHINGDPSDNRMENIIMYCPTHHTMADRGIIDRKASRKYKELLHNQNGYTGEQILKTLETIKKKIGTISKNKTSGRKQRKFSGRKNYER